MKALSRLLRAVPPPSPLPLAVSNVVFAPQLAACTNAEHVSVLQARPAWILARAVGFQHGPEGLGLEDCSK
jgi:hypothetical protein